MQMWQLLLQDHSANVVAAGIDGTTALMYALGSSLLYAWWENTKRTLKLHPFVSPVFTMFWVGPLAGALQLPDMR